MSFAPRPWIQRFALSLAAVAILSPTAYTSGGETHGTVRVETYRTPDGETYSAVALKPERIKDRALDVVVVVDTSASQTGEHFITTQKSVIGLLSALDSGARVMVVASDIAPQDLMSGFAAVGSKEVRDALQKLQDRTPLGNCDLKASLGHASSLLDETSRARRIVYIGDGHQTAGLWAPQEIDSLIGDLKKAKTSLHTVAVGADVNDVLMGRLSSQTGGVFHESSTSGTVMARSLESAVIYPENIRFSDAGLSFRPNPVPPLRSDRENLFVARGRISESLTVELDGRIGDEALDAEWTGFVRSSSPDNAYLVDLWTKWQKDESGAAPAGAKETLELAKASHEISVTNLMTYAELSVGHRLWDQAENYLKKVIELDPSNLDAKAMIKGIEKERTLAKVQDPPPPAAAPAVGQEPTPPQPGEAGASSDSTVPQSQATIQQALKNEQLATEQLRAEIRAVISQSRRLLGTDPDYVIDQLKLQLERIDVAIGVPDVAKIELRRQVEAYLRNASRERLRLELDTAEQQQLAARALELQKMNNLLAARQERLKQVNNQFLALMAEQDFKAARVVADSMRALSRGDDNVEPFAIAMFGTSDVLANLTEQQQLLEFRRFRSALTLLSVDKSHIPFPDEPPVEYPDATWWREMSKRRLAKWANVDLTRPSPAEEKIRSKLDDPVTLEFVETPLGDVVDFLRNLTGVNIVLDTVPLEDEGVTSDTPVTIHVETISLKSALKLLLGSLNATYVIKDDVLQITSEIEAGQELIHKVYPVADLVIPVSAGLGGGMMGGMMGGGGGMGGGGMGGGMGGGGMGGGMGGGGMGGGGGFGFRNFGGGGGGNNGGGQGGDDLSDELMELIQEVVDPDSWEANGGDGSIRYYRNNPAFIINQTQANHEKIGGGLLNRAGRAKGLKNVNP